MKILALLTTLVALAAPATAAARMPSGPYRTDRQAERFLQRTRGGSAFCINGFYSRHEQRTGRHYRQRSGERFRSFACTWTSDAGRTIDLYLQTRPHGGWVVTRDR